MSLTPFQALLDAHGRDVHRFLIALVGPADADDCYQETWLAALRAYPSLRPQSNSRSWIFTVAHNKAIDQLRATGRRAVPVADVPEQPEPPPIEHEGAGELWEHVRRLPDKQRMAVALRFLIGDLAVARADQIGRAHV